MVGAAFVLLGLLILGCVPRQNTVGEAVGSASGRVEPEVILEFAPQVLAEVSPAVVTAEPGQQGAEEAVILIGRKIERSSTPRSKSLTASCR